MTVDFNQIILEQVTGYIIIATQDGKMVHWSHGAVSVFGCIAKEALGCRLEDITHLKSGLTKPVKADALTKTIDSAMAQADASDSAATDNTPGTLVANNLDDDRGKR